MHTLLDLMERFRPGVGETIAPAAEEQIAALEHVAGPLPGAYLRFLRTMGGSLGNLEVLTMSFDIEGVLATYFQKPWLRRERYLMIAQDEGLSAYDLYLDLAAPHGADDCMVVRMPLDPAFDPRDRQPYHAGLEELLYYEVYRTMRLPEFEHQLTMVAPVRTTRAAPTAEVVSAVADRLGLSRIPPATRCALHERGDAGLLLYQHPVEAGFSFVLGAHDRRVLVELSEKFRGQAGVTEHA